MRILLDLDDTLANWGAEYDRRLDASSDPITRGIPRFNDLTSYDLFGALDDDSNEMLKSIMNEPGFYASLDPMPGAIDAVYRMQEDGHEVWIVSTPWVGNETCETDKREWVQKHLGNEWANRLILTHDKTMIAGDVIIDDKPHITGKDDPKWQHILFAQPHNLTERAKRLRRGILNWTDGEWIKELEYYTRPVTADGEVRSVSSTGGLKGVKRARYDLIPYGALHQLAEHYGRGAEKYDDWQWRKGYEWGKSYAALQRHAQAYWNGEDNDAETGSNHMAAVAWHAFTLLTFHDEFPEFDDRYRGCGE
jgi:5'-nucleotidase